MQSYKKFIFVVMPRLMFSRLCGWVWMKTSIYYHFIAGILIKGTVLECEEKDWDSSFNVNIKSMFWTCKNFTPKMLVQGSGRNRVDYQFGINSIQCSWSDKQDCICCNQGCRQWVDQIYCC